MSDPIVKAERSRAKDARQSPPPEPARHGKKFAKAKPFGLIMIPIVGKNHWTRQRVQHCQYQWYRKARDRDNALDLYRSRTERDAPYWGKYLYEPIE